MNGILWSEIMNKAGAEHAGGPCPTFYVTWLIVMCCLPY